MDDVTVDILLSCYNGERYLKEQINSIIQQTYQNWNLIVRDDGSSDGTITLLREFEKKDGRIHILINHKNKGIIPSFHTLLENSVNKYIMFCDQDDIWLPFKVQETLNKMQKLETINPGLPLLVHTDLTSVSSDLKILSSRLIGANYANSFNQLLVFNDVTGCTMMINDKLKQISQRSNWDKISMHDWWLAQIAAAFGKIGYVNKSTILYRQHENNTLGVTKSLKSRLSKLMKYNVEIERFNKSWIQAKYFKNVYGSELNVFYQNILIQFIKLPTVNNIVKLIEIMRRYNLKKQTLLGNLSMIYILTIKRKRIIQID